MSNWLAGPLPLNHTILDRGFARIEKQCLNPYGWIPGFGAAFAMVRMAMGIAQIVMAIVLPIFNLIRGSFAYPSEQNFLIRDAAKVLPYAWHGIANVIRAQIESVAGLGLLCKLYDLALWRIKYEDEEPSESQPPVRILRRSAGDQEPIPVT